VALSDDELATITRLERRHDAEIPELEALDRYYEGTQPMSYMHPEIFAEASERIHPVVIMWTQLAVDAIAERLSLQGIKSGNEDLDDEFNRVWQANAMDVGLSQAVTDALVMRRSYMCVGSNEADSDTPLVTPESPLELYVDTDPRTRKGRAALRRTSDVDPLGNVGVRYATLYLPDRTVWCTWSGGWKEERRDVHNLGELPIGSLINRPRTRSSIRTPRNAMVERVGRSDLDPVVPLTDAANKLATDMMVAAEFVAIPLRVLFGVSATDFEDEKGNKLTAMRAVLGRLITISEPEAKAFEFAAAMLDNFTGALKAMSQLVGSVTGLPPSYLGTPSDNPASAEAITASESRLATRSEGKQPSFGSGVRNVARLIHRFRTGEWEPELDTCKIDWRNVRTPTIAAQADAAVKLYTTTPQPIVPLKQTREALGYSDDEIEEMEEQDELAAARSPSGRLAGALDDQRVMFDDGAGQPTDS
jgi:hypothetical protein